MSRSTPHATLIDVASLAALIGRADVAVVDCRFSLAAPAAGREAFRTAHIPGARYADLAQDLSAPVGPGTGRHPLPEPGRFARTLGALGIDNESQVIAYDEGGGSFAARLWWMLRWLGSTRVAVLDGGFAAWTAAGGALQSGDAAATPLAFRPPAGGPRRHALLTTAEVLAALRDPRRRLLVDARAPERYAGAVEPLDPVAGHVPQAVNHPFGENLAADGRFLAPAELRRRWLALLSGIAPADVIVMCGSGVTACHHLLALETAGLPGAKLYAGSWSEWIQDPERPVARRTTP